MKAFLDIVNTIETAFNDDPNVGAVTYGDIFEVALDKKNMYPLAHYIVANVTPTGSTLVFDVACLNMDLPSNVEKDIYAWSAQLAIINRLIENLRRGDLWSELYQLDGNPICQAFANRFDQGLIGWETTFQIVVPNKMGIDHGG